MRKNPKPAVAPNAVANLKKKILVLCTGNSCRSQIAEGYLRQFAGNLAEVFSAGIETHGVNPKAIRVMREDGVDISGQTSDNVNRYLHIPFDFVITVCDNALESCPLFPGSGKKFHQDFTDPARLTGSEEVVLDAFRAVRDQIKKYCRSWVDDNLKP